MLQYQDQSLRPLTTAHLAQTMSLLVLSNEELQEKIDAELSENPALELVEDHSCPTCHRPLVSKGPCPICSAQHQQSQDSIVFVSPKESLRTSGVFNHNEELMDREPAAPENLGLSVLKQLAADLESDDRSLAAYILSSLDEDGYLQDHPALIARTNRVPLQQVQRVLNLIAQADPPGLATLGPRQALLAQLNQYDQRLPSISLASEILEHNFKELGKRDFDAIAKKLDVKVHKVRQAAAFIHDSLNPYPARSFWGSGHQPAVQDPNVYHTPDIKISVNPLDPQGALLVEIFTSHAGWLRVNPMFQKALATANGTQTEAWTEHLERASLFVKCIQQRNNTMRRLMEILVTEQRQFILEGDRYLSPITRAKIAEIIGVHESTISRAVAHKSLELPGGRIIPLSRFFDRSLSVRDRIKEIVENEIRPLTDDEISMILEEEGIKVARRTVAKYRAIEGILTARLRKRILKPSAIRA